MGTPHVHAEVIKAWADGKEVQYFGCASGMWRDTDKPIWEKEVEYRVKPETLRYRVALINSTGGPYIECIQYAVNQRCVEECTGFSRWLTDWVEVEV